MKCLLLFSFLLRRKAAKKKHSFQRMNKLSVDERHCSVAASHHWLAVLFGKSKRRAMLLIYRNPGSCLLAGTSVIYSRMGSIHWIRHK
jgi:hypothetical protein